MTDDPKGSVGTRVMFEAIVSRLRDPELVRIRRVVLLLGVAILMAAVAVTIVGGLGWPALVAFCSTFVPSWFVVRGIAGRPLRVTSGRRRRKQM